VSELKLVSASALLLRTGEWEERAGDKQYPLSRGLPRAGWRAVGDSTPVILPLLAEETKVGRLGGEGAKELVDEAL